MAKIFISYRRQDSEGSTGRLFDWLSGHFGRENVFMDVDGIEPGLDFGEVIDQKVSSCDVLLAVIGTKWLSIDDEAGKRRLDNPNDYVRLEISTALNRNIRVIPLLVDKAEMPKPDNLPNNLKNLTRRNAQEISNIRFHADVDRLIEVLDQIFKPAQPVAVHQSQPEISKVVDLQSRFDQVLDLEEWEVAISLGEQLLELIPQDTALREKLISIYSTRATDFFENKEFELAIKELNGVLKLDPKSVKTLLKRGQAYHHQGQFIEAIEDYTQAIKLEPRNAHAYFYRAKTLIDNKKPDAALKDFNRSIQIDSTNGEFYYMRAELYRQQNLTEQYLADLSQACKFNYYEAALDLFAIDPERIALDLVIEMGEQLEVKTSLNERQRNNLALAYFNRGDRYLGEQEYELARIDYTKSIDLNPDSVIAFNRRGTTYYNLQQFDEALADYERAIKLAPDFPVSYMNRGQIYFDRGQYAQAVEDLSVMLNYDTRSSRAYYLRGLSQKALSNLSEARNDLHKAAELGYPGALEEVQEMEFVQRNRFIKALESSADEEVIALVSEFDSLDWLSESEKARVAFIYNKRGDLFYSQQQYEPAFADYSKAIKLNPEFADPYNGRGNVYDAQKDYEKAIPEYSQAINLNPDFSFAYNGRGLTYTSLKKYPQAISDFSKAIELNRMGDFAYYNRGLARKAEGNGKAALEDLRKAAELGNPGAAKLAQRLESEIQQEVEKSRQERAVLLLQELLNPATNHKRRREIGDRLGKIGDTRPGAGIAATSVGDRRLILPYLEWCDVPAPPGGKVWLGAKDQGDNPRQEVTLNYGFKMAKFLTTYQQFQTFADSGQYPDPRWWQNFPKQYQPQELNQHYQKADNYPRDNVSWYQAVAFTRWLTEGYRAAGWLDSSLEIRLPTGTEWEYAARGRDERAYPWGKWQSEYANTKEANLEQTTAVGMYPQGASPFGVLDMSGNLWEWCWNKYSNNSGSRELRGGSFYNYASLAACAYRLSNLPLIVVYRFGFRVVVAAPNRASDL